MSYRKERSEKFSIFIEKYRDRITPLGWINLSRHNLVTFEFLQPFPELSIDSMSANPNITPDIIRRNMNLDWNFVKYSANPRNTIEFILENPDKNWCWIAISKTLRNIARAVALYPDLPWSWHEIGYNRNIGESFILKYSKKLTSVWVHDHISLKFISSHPEVRWTSIDFALSMRSDVTPEMFDCPDYSMLSAYLSVDYIMSRPDLPWKDDSISFNYSVKTHHIVDRPDVVWNWEYMCSPHVDIDMYWENARDKFYTLPSVPIDRIFDSDLREADILAITANPLNECMSDRETFLKRRAVKKIYYWWIEICYDDNLPVGMRMAERNYERYLEL